MIDHSTVRVRGALAPFADGFWEDLLSQGYSPLSSLNLLRVMAHLGRWLKDQRLEPSDLTQQQIEMYLKYRRKCGYILWLCERGLNPMLHFLRDAGAIPAREVIADPSPAAEVLNGFSDYLINERGLSPETVSTYLRAAREFLTVRFGDSAPDVGSITAADVTTFFVQQTRTSSVGTANLFGTGLRSFLRHLHLRGDLKNDLSAAVLRASSRRLVGLPRGLRPDDVAKLYGGCDRRTHVGRRNFAILLLLTRLGLRAGEVAAMLLDDVLWAEGELQVCSKGRRDRLPLPRDVGEAMAAYAKKSRPDSDSRRFFLQTRAPFRNLTPGTIGAMVSYVGHRVGLDGVHPHRLRHTAATRMLAQGASLSQIAQVLRHAHINTTAIYAKVDHKSLAAVARPWPERQP